MCGYEVPRAFNRGRGWRVPNNKIPSHKYEFKIPNPSYISNLIYLFLWFAEMARCLLHWSCSEWRPTATFSGLTLPEMASSPRYLMTAQRPQKRPTPTARTKPWWMWTTITTIVWAKYELGFQLTKDTVIVSKNWLPRILMWKKKLNSFFFVKSISRKKISKRSWISGFLKSELFLKTINGWDWHIFWLN